MKWLNNNDLDIENLPPFRYCTPQHKYWKEQGASIAALNSKVLFHIKGATSPKDDFQDIG